MALTRNLHRVTSAATGDTTAFVGGVLTVDLAGAAALVRDPALAEVRVSWVSPGDPVRIVKVLDAVQPRTKGPGGGGIFPGLLGPAVPQGTGVTHVLADTAVVVAGFLPRAQEAVVDMSGPAAELSPLATTHNLVIEFTPASEARWEDVDLALRRGSLSLAARLAETVLGVEPDEVVTLPGLGEDDPAAKGNGHLPRVGAVTNLQTQGAFKDTFVYGRSFAGSFPLLLDANELEDGAVVSGQFGHPSLKNPTWIHQNHPVVAALRARHGTEVAFAGVILCPEPVDQNGKVLLSAATARLAAAAGWDGAVVTKEGGGNADADMALKMDELEALGLTAVGLFAEMAGADGTGPSVVVPPERATAMVSTGNYDQRLALPAMERSLGGDTLTLVGCPAADAVELPAAVIYASLSPLGWGRLTCGAGVGQ